MKTGYDKLTFNERRFMERRLEEIAAEYGKLNVLDWAVDEIRALTKQQIQDAAKNQLELDLDGRD